MTRVELATLCLASTRSSQLSYTRIGGKNCSTARGSVNGANMDSHVLMACPGYQVFNEGESRCSALSPRAQVQDRSWSVRPFCSARARKVAAKRSITCSRS